MKERCAKRERSDARKERGEKRERSRSAATNANGNLRPPHHSGRAGGIPSAVLTASGSKAGGTDRVPISARRHGFARPQSSCFLARCQWAMSGLPDAAAAATAVPPSLPPPATPPAAHSKPFPPHCTNVHSTLHTRYFTLHCPSVRTALPDTSHCTAVTAHCTGRYSNRRVSPLFSMVVAEVFRTAFV